MVISKISFPQAESASDRDIHTAIAKEIKSRFNRRPVPSISTAGIRLVAATALDKESRFFEGPKHAQLTLPDKSVHEEDDNDEIF